MPSDNCTTIRTPSISMVVSMGALTPLHIWCATQGRLKAIESPQSLGSQTRGSCYCRRCRCFYRLSCCIASYAIAMAFPLYIPSSRASSRFGIWFGIRFYSTSQPRLPLFDTPRGRTSFYDCFTTTSFFFLLHDKSPYKDEYESDTPFWYETRKN
jgi:hypothetical protein